MSRGSHIALAEEGSTIQMNASDNHDKLAKLKEENQQLRAELQSYRHAFETTARDRDNLSRLFQEAVDPLDAGYFRLDLQKFQQADNEALANTLANQWEQSFTAGDFGSVVTSILENAPVKLAQQVPDEYLRSIAAYLLASFFVRRREFEKAVQFSDHFYYGAPIDGADLLPYDIQQATRISSYRQQRNLALNKPGAVIVSLMKSASAFLCDAIAKIFDVLVLRASLGEAMRSVVIKKWADQIALGGAVTHEHYQALPVNLNALSSSNVSKLWVQIRDPRDAAFSLRKMKPMIPVSFQKPTLENSELNEAERMFLTDSTYMASWIGQWIDAANSKTTNLDIEFLKYQDVTSDLVGTLERMFPNHFDDEKKQRTKEFLNQIQHSEIGRPNFRKGTGGEWREAYSEAVQEEAWKSIPTSVKNLLQLTP